MKNFFLGLTLLFSILLPFTTFSQDIQICGAPQAEKKFRENNPQILIDESRLK
jgi:hypothetical protein